MTQYQKAIITRNLGQAEFVSDRSLPSLREGYLLVQTIAVALNPIDWRRLENTPAPGATMGHDYAGVVVAVGASVRRKFQVGDRVCGLVNGGDGTQVENGSFAEYIVVSFVDAATGGVGIMPVGRCLYGPFGLGLQLPEIGHKKPKEAILIYGGSTASALWGIQFAKLSGYIVVTTCSPHNYKLVKAYGADVIIEYHDPECRKRIREATDNALGMVWDTVATVESAKICADVISSAGGKYHALLPVQAPRADVISGFTDAGTVTGEPFEYGPQRTTIPAMPDEFTFAIR
ncbi:chaperonin 10-like protein [Aspergillus ambiguus]|uniref:zinc-binding alcohol dehydrogenase family protein n=1 Tax=Aspergillus ambiguus TaxID=176160 RepID=UPI003CCC9033